MKIKKLSFIPIVMLTLTGCLSGNMDSFNHENYESSISRDGKTYTVNVENEYPELGTVSNTGEYCAGDYVQLEFQTDYGEYFTGYYNIDSDNYLECESTGFGFTMPNENVNLSIGWSLPTFSVLYFDEYNANICGYEAPYGTHLSIPENPRILEIMNDPNFLGWRNTSNGGQLWDFDNPSLNRVYGDVILSPVFANQNNKYTFEAELCPDIKNLEGKTYSGGAMGRGLIRKVYENKYGSTSVDKIVYKKDAAGNIYDTFENTAADTVTCTETVKYGAFVHFNYTRGNALTWEIESDMAVDNAILSARFSMEYYNRMDYDTRLGYSSFDENQYPVYVNGIKMNYGGISFDRFVPHDFIYFQDFILSTNVSLNKGKNLIQMVVDNNKYLMNDLIDATAPVVDSIKLYTNATLNWNKCCYTNLVNV